MIEYELVENFYGDKRAKRTGIPYMKHIDDGLVLLKYYGTSETTNGAFCLHPLYQDAEEETNAIMFEFLGSLKPEERVSLTRSIQLARLFRYYADQYTTKCHSRGPAAIDLPKNNPDVLTLLKVDKIQNLMDAEQYLFSKNSVERERLFPYFNDWLSALGVSPLEYERAIQYVKEKRGDYEIPVSS